MKITLNKDRRIVKAIKRGLEESGGFCPCKTEKIDANRCMCDEFRNQISDPDFEGFCPCMLYYKSAKD